MGDNINADREQDAIGNVRGEFGKHICMLDFAVSSRAVYLAHRELVLTMLRLSQTDPGARRAGGQ